MSPRTVDLKIVRERLDLLGRLLADLRRLPNESYDAFTKDWRNAPTAESLIRRAVEALLDTARHLLSCAFGLGALEYRQVARFSAEKGLVQDAELQDRLAKIAGFRNRLAHHYEDVTPEEIYGLLRDRLTDLERLADELDQAAARLSGGGLR